MSKTNAWDFGRFLQTVTYFDALPGLSQLKRLQQMVLGETTDAGAVSVPLTGTILVTGATGRVGQLVVRQLRSRDLPVRALVRDAQTARLLFDEHVECVEGDLGDRDSLSSDWLASVGAIVHCAGVRVRPDAAGKMQAEMSPEAIEARGVENLVELARDRLFPATERAIFAFATPRPEWGALWGAIDDVVMGGVSESGLRLLARSALFAGKVSTDNNGGFASIRTRNVSPPLDLSGYEGITLRVKGDGQRYKFILRNEARWDGVAYSMSFDTPKDEWLDVCVPFGELVPVFRAKTLSDAPRFDPSQTHAMQLMLSKFEYDRALNPNFSPGNFALEIESIRAYGGAATPQLVFVSSMGASNPDRLNLPPDSLMGEILRWKARGETSVRESGLTYAIVRPGGLTDTPGDRALSLSQGDTSLGRVSREAIARLCVQALFSPQAVNKTFEVCETEAPAGDLNWEALFSCLERD